MKRNAKYVNLLITILVFTLSCNVDYKYEEIFKKVASDFIKEEGFEMIEMMMDDSINNMTVVIQKKGFLVPNSIPPPRLGEKGIKFTYPPLDLYVFHYTNHYFDNEFLPPPSKLFYVDGYPILFYTNEIPSMNKNDIPKYLYRNEKVWAGGDGWLVAICKKTHQYIVIQDSYMKGDETIKEVDKFNERCLSEK